MLAEILVLFIIITIIMFILSVYTVDENPTLSIPFIMVGMIFCVLCAYGMWNVETQYIGYNATLGNTSFYTQSVSTYGDPYSYVFLAFFFIFVLLFIRSGWNLWKEALETKGQMDYKKMNGNKWR